MEECNKSYGANNHTSLLSHAQSQSQEMEQEMEQLFTNRKFHFSYHRNFRVFFLNGKRPCSLIRISVEGSWC